VKGKDYSCAKARCRAVHAFVVVVAMLVGASLCGCGDGSEPPPPNPLFVDAARGADGNSGTADEPLRTISRALQIARDGYFVVVAPGTYDETLTTDRPGFAAASALVLVADFTGELTRRFGGMPDPRRVDVVVDATGNPHEALKLNSSPGTTVDGFIFRGGPVVANKSPRAQIRNCEVTGSPGDGVRVQDSNEAIVFNNLVHHNAGIGIAIVPRSQNVRIIHNTVVRNGERGVSVGNTKGAAPGAFLRNNIIQQNGPADRPDNIKVFDHTDPAFDSLRGYDGDYNLVFPAVYVPTSLGRSARHDINLDAGFASANPTGREGFLLRCDNLPSCTRGSPALDVGDEIEEPYRGCLAKWSAVGNGNRDLGPLDLGFHMASSDPHCGIPLPSPP